MAKPTIRLWLREDKTKAKVSKGIISEGAIEVTPIHLIYQVRGVRVYYNTGISLFPFNWDKSTQRAVYLDKRAAKAQKINIDPYLLPLSRDIDQVNTDLYGIIDEIRKIERRFNEDKLAFGARNVIDELKERNKPLLKRDQSKRDVTAYIDKYIEEQSTTLTKGSLTVFRSLKKHLLAFSKVNKRIDFEHMDLAFFKAFQTFLITTPVYKEINGKRIKIADGLRNTTVAKQLSTLKTVLRYADKSGIAVNNRYQSFEIKREALPVIALTQAEFNKLYEANLAGNERLERTRDVFCFACCTGLRYSDLAVLKRDNLKRGGIEITVVKTKQRLFVPLNDYARSILSKYSDQRRPLPVISNQKLNKYIKELAESVGINENVEVVRFRGAERITSNYPKHELIGVHTGRKTFCTLSLERGMSAEQGMAISGHKDYKSFKRYVNITNEVKTQAIVKAWSMPEPLKRVK